MSTGFLEFSRVGYLNLNGYTRLVSCFGRRRSRSTSALFLVIADKFVGIRNLNLGRYTRTQHTSCSP